MKQVWERFRTYKQRGEWVEALFIAQALLHGFNVSKPWGDSCAYDVIVELGTYFLRVQVKSTSVRNGTGYFCQFKPNYYKKEDYTLDQVDLFAAYVIPVDTWYLIPASVILKPTRKTGVTLYPVDALKKNRYRYEHYREAWGLLGKTREELADLQKRARKTRVLRGRAQSPKSGAPLLAGVARSGDFSAES